ISIEKLSPTSWSARIADPVTGRRVRVTASSELKVQAKIEKIRSARDDLRFGNIGPREAEREIALTLRGAPTVLELWENYVQLLHGQHAVNTRGLWAVRLEPYFGKRTQVFTLTPQVMAEWERDQLKKGMSPKTILNAFWCLKSAIRAGIPDRVHEVPWQRWRPRPKPAGEEQE